MSLLQLQAMAGLCALLLSAWAMGGCRRNVRLRPLVAALGLQLGLAALLLWLPAMRAGFALLSDGVQALANATRAGTALVFGYLGGGPLPFEEKQPAASFILFFQALPLVLVVGALSAVLHHWGVLPALVRAMARVFHRLLGLSGPAAFAVAANIFVGMVEAPLLIRAWLSRLSRAELFVVMTAGLATISGNTLALYALTVAPIQPDAAGQLVAASLISAPAAVAIAQVMLPEDAATNAPIAATAIDPILYDSTMEALVRGTQDGLHLLFAIMASLIVFVALVALLNQILVPIAGTSLQALLGWLLWPVALAMGVPVAEAGVVAASLGVKIVINEFVAYLELAGSGGAGLSERSQLILIYALCGFANLGSVGIMVGGISTLCPERRAEIVRLGLPALLSGTLACAMTGAVVGMLTAP